jgi:hypothetical protein
MASSPPRVRLCVRELETGMRCAHHLLTHPGGGRCAGLDPFGEPCPCQGYQEPAPEAEARP